jgi:hypothetical protein
MYFKVFALPILLSLTVEACAIRPLPEDLPGGVDTFTIVRKVRCEASDAIANARIEYLNDRYLSKTDQPLLHNYDELRRLIKTGTIPPKFTNNFEKTSKAGIVYAFTIQGTEMNNLSVSANITGPLNYGAVSLGPTASNNLTRENTRTFTVIDTFDKLLARQGTKYCMFNPPTPGNTYPNYEYPILGNIGLDETVRTFIRLAVTGSISGEEQLGAFSEPDFDPAKNPAMVDSITFTTTVNAGLNPSISFSPVKTHWQVQSTTIGATATRTDVHQVIVGLALPSTPTAGPISANGSKLANLYLSAQKPTPNTGEGAALQAVAQQILRSQTLVSPLFVAP